ncbi:hypothetical protein M501DRAFT_1012358 [Patellaria atrata CBS 101060]|uniref:Uncharacterized protein n=1 Tax=Patellaria atrata CBS 101060 TaxID=1346257 RepID=A0A9P4SHE5_9PEZI|nr:hypothetical protein M501DRAFT_1012358 [Patellaria atrata CBS 101060]
MSSETPEKSYTKDNKQQDADFAQAFKELQKGESTAAALEKHLTELESKIEELLAKADEEKRSLAQDSTSPDGSEKSNPS